MNNGNVKNNYKDTIFRMLFSEKEALLSLYNALNKTCYTDTEGLKITTLENAVYMNYRNDISFVFSSELMLYEHQSTFNPNMPLRNLIYVTRILQGMIKDRDLYSSVLIKIPVPRFVIFYNGTTPQPERRILKLSDAFEEEFPSETEKTKQPELELIVTAYNINAGCNSELMEACHLLKEYAQYVEQVRKHARTTDLPQAVEKAVDYCIHNGILADFLAKNRAEAIAMSIFEYDEEKHIKNEKEISYQEGRKSGIAEGRKSGIAEGRKSGIAEGHKSGIAEGEERLNLLYMKLVADNRIDDLHKSMKDKNYRQMLYAEYGI